MDIALQNFDVHAFRAAFQMVNIIISKQMFCQPFHLYNTLAISLDALCLVTSFLMFNVVLKKGSGHSGLVDEYVFLFT